MNCHGCTLTGVPALSLLTDTPIPSLGGGPTIPVPLTAWAGALASPEGRRRLGGLCRAGGAPARHHGHLRLKKRLQFAHLALCRGAQRFVWMEMIVGDGTRKAILTPRRQTRWLTHVAVVLLDPAPRVLLNQSFDQTPRLLPVADVGRNSGARAVEISQGCCMVLDLWIVIICRKIVTFILYDYNFF